ncbi:hypothetical protein, partial [Aeromonas caviae]
RRQQGDGGGVFGDSQFTSTLSVNFHFPRIPRRTFFYAYRSKSLVPPLLDKKVLSKGIIGVCCPWPP